MARSGRRRRLLRQLGGVEIGRPAGGALRELVRSRGRSGYLALYDFSQAEDTVFILGLRHQRKAGYE
jgi:hypothetical protein